MITETASTERGEHVPQAPGTGPPAPRVPLALPSAGRAGGNQRPADWRKPGRWGRAVEQLRFLRGDIARFPRPLGRSWLTCWAEPSFVVVLSYRVTRAFCLLLGPAWPLVRLLFAPLAFLLRPWVGRGEIHPMAEIGPGLYLLHPSLGVVISGHAVIGEGLTLLGGNCIGVRAALQPGELILEEDVTMGVNSVVLGPVRVGRGTTLGAGAVLIHDTPAGAVVGGVPARGLRTDPTV